MQGILRSVQALMVLAALGVFGCPWCRAGEGPIAEGAPVIAPEQIEADWLRQEVVRVAPLSGPARAGSVAPEEDAAGAVDGVKDGRWGFHTAIEENPWWQVDLKETATLGAVRIFNRCDSPEAPPRAARLRLLLSDDGKAWRQVYQHDGTAFGGAKDNKPLVVPLGGQAARYVRIQLPGKVPLHLDEVEVLEAGKDAPRNLALGRPATQSSTSQWSTARRLPVACQQAAENDPITPAGLARAVQAGLRLAEDLRRRGAEVDEQARSLAEVAQWLKQHPAHATQPELRRRYLEARWATRRIALKNPLLDFDDLVFVRRAPGSFTHMSDQYYGWFSRPGGGLHVLQGWKTDSPRLRRLAGELPPGSVLRPDLSYDGKRVLFAHARYYPGLASERNKLDKSRIPEDAFYHLYEVNLDGTGLHRLTRGKYDDFDGRYLPDGRIVFLSTRRGQHVQCSVASGLASADGSLPDCYVRCGGGPERPVAVYTLHVMDADGSKLHPISAFENFEWTPSVDHDGRILYARWDYVDRDKMPYMKLWSTMPDGTNAQALFGNYIQRPHCVFEARAIPGSSKLIFTASGHHAFTGGSLVLLDLNKGADGEWPMTRLTPEVCFPEIEGWPPTYFTSPYPLSEEHYLVAWSDRPLPPGVPPPGWGMPGPVNDLGLYLFDTFGNLNLIYRDTQLGSECALPVRPRPMPPKIVSVADAEGPQTGQMLLIDVYEGLESIPRGAVRRLRVVGVPVKTHPTMNYPSLGITGDDPGKFVLGTVPVEADGSAHFSVPSGVPFFMQALDEQGMAVQTMRSATYLQPGQKATCVGCHEPRNTAPPNVLPLAARREPSKFSPGPEGSWPLDFRALVQPVLDRQCTSCHKPGGKDPKLLLTSERSYDALVNYGKPSLRSVVWTNYNRGRSTAGQGESKTSALLALLDKGHYDVRLTEDDRQRLITWLDTYGQRLGSYDAQQEERLRDLRRRMAPLLAR